MKGIGDRFDWVCAVAAADPRPTLAELAVAAALAKFLNASRGMAWPAQQTLAGLLRMDRRSIRKALIGLENRGFIERIRDGGPKVSTGYALSDGALRRHQMAPCAAISRRSTPPSDGALQRHEQVGSRSEAVGNLHSAANAPGSGCADAAPPPHARGVRATPKTKAARRRALKRPVPVAF